MTWTKICGITNAADAKMCAEAGADALGFLIGHSDTNKKYISLEKAIVIISGVPESVQTVYVTKETNIQEIARIANECGAQVIQLHGNLAPSDAIKLRALVPTKKIFKAIHVEDESSITEAKSFESVADMIFLDSASEEGGGSGKTHDWSLSSKIVESVSIPVVLAGGLTPENVAEAISKVHPFGVDVSSGVMNSDATKNESNAQLFIFAAKK